MNFKVLCPSRLHVPILGLALAVSGFTYAQADATQSGATTTPGQLQTTPTPAATVSDAQIVGVLEAANQGEIDQAKVAQKSGKAKPVKDFAKMMIGEHGKVLKEVKALSAKAKLKPADSDAKTALVTAKDQGLTRLKALKGSEFDKAYATEQVTMHQGLLDTIDSTLMPNAQHPELKAMIEKIRPSIASHLDQAKALQTSLGSQM